MGYSDTLYFATSGIRGKANTVISPELGLRVGRAVAAWLRNMNYSDMSVYVGYDSRRNSQIIASTVVAGLSSSGVDARLFVKPVPTPLVIHATTKSEARAGIMITGSHLPKDENGIILFDTDGNYFKGILPDSTEDPVDWHDLGRIHNVEEELQEYEHFLNRLAREQGIRKVDWDVLVDPVHGPMKKYLEMVVKPYVHNLIQFNWEEDDTFSGRLSEPTPKNLVQTSKAVTISKCQFGVATDMDGDRVIYLTKSGRVITGDYVGAILARKFFTEYPDLPVVVPINTSAIIDYVAEETGGTVHYCKVGPPSIIQAIRETRAKFGFEETGKYFFSDYAIWPDAAISTIMMMGYLQSTKMDLEEILNTLPKLYILKTKVPSKRENGKTVEELVRNRIFDYFENVNNINDMDGLRINFDDKSWLLIRQSGTEDYMRVFSEHSNEQKNEELNMKGQEIVQNVIEELNLEHVRERD